jgi:hypothetical protein
VYWQTLAINPFDQIGHVLRGLFILGSPCASYQTGDGYGTDKKTTDLFNKCNAWMGPYQPGVNATDPTGEVNNKKSASKDKPIPDTGGPPRGTPEAKPAPGQPDLSKPQIVLPKEIQNLLDTLKVPGTAPSLPNLPQLPDVNQLTPQQIQQLTDTLQQLGVTGATGPAGATNDPTQLLNYLLGK